MMMPPFAVSFSNTPKDGLLQPNARTTDESFSGSSAASLRGRRFPFSDARPLFAVRLVSRVSRLRQGHLQHWKSRVLLRFPLQDNLRGGLSPPPSKRKDLLASGCYGSGDLVERRVSDVKGFNLRGSLNYRGEDLRHFWVSSAAVSLGILRFVPQTDSERFRAALSNERDFVLESFLFSKQREDVLLQPLGKLRNAIGLQITKIGSIILKTPSVS